MPCNSDYLNYSNQELELKKVFDFLDEIYSKPVKSKSIYNDIRV